MIKRITGEDLPKRHSHCFSHADAPFTDDIVLIEIPKKSMIPALNRYDRSIVPENHVAQYKHRMLIVYVPMESRGVVMCRSNISSLTRPTIRQ
ncbi:unnamed protein product [Cochlearia groenlandica]